MLARALALLLAMSVMLAVIAQAEEKAAPEGDFRSLQIKLAEARLQLAQLELKVAQAQNKQDDGLVPQVVIEALELSLAKAKAQLAMAQGDATQVREALSAAADASVAVSKARLARQKQFAQRTGDANSPDVNRAQLRVDIAELEQQSLKLLQDQPVEQQLLWHVERINAMIDGLSDRVIVLEDKR